MLDIVSGLPDALALQSILAMAAGTAVGIMVGAIPGLTATLAMALLLPFTYTLSPLTFLGMMAGIYNGSMYGGAIPAILMKIPGTPSAVATTFDGYPLARAGRARFALHVALLASAAGSMMSAISLMLVAPPLVDLALKFGPVEYFWIAVFGLSAVALLVGQSPAKGIASALIGIGIGIVGMDMMTGEERLVFGVRDIAGGVNLAVLLTGLFAVPPALAMMNDTMVREGARLTGDGIRLKELPGFVKTWLRSGAIGVIVGVMPGAGGNLAGIFGYSEEKRAAKDKSLFGKGDPRGIAASECANNADNASSLIPTLALGVPGNSVAALIMGAMLIQGLTPGPGLFSQHGQIVHAFMWQMLFTAGLMLAFGFVGASIFVQMLRIPKTILAPMILIICSIGTYSASNSMVDVWLMLVFGTFAWLLSRSAYPIAPIVLGAILGPLAESSFRQSMLITRGDPSGFADSAIAITLIIAILAVVIVPLIRALKGLRGDGDRQKERPSQ